MIKAQVCVRFKSNKVEKAKRVKIEIGYEPTSDQNNETKEVKWFEDQEMVENHLWGLESIDENDVNELQKISLKDQKECGFYIKKKNIIKHQKS